MFSPIIELNGIDPCYRAVLVNGNGLPVSTVCIKAAGDDEAAVQAKALVDGHSVDLWDGIRFIEHFPTVPPSTGI